jgi:hypothetical protein
MKRCLCLYAYMCDAYLFFLSCIKIHLRNGRLRLPGERLRDLQKKGMGGGIAMNISVDKQSFFYMKFIISNILRLTS